MFKIYSNCYTQVKDQIYSISKSMIWSNDVDIFCRNVYLIIFNCFQFIINTIFAKYFSINKNLKNLKNQVMDSLLPIHRLKSS